MHEWDQFEAIDNSIVYELSKAGCVQKVKQKFNKKMNSTTVREMNTIYAC